ncbi:MAG: hypothetical protein ACKORI_04095, partial [Verrucomicrobiota bacterium]
MRYSVLPDLCLALLLGGCASSSVPPVKSARPPVMTSTAFDWDKLEYKPTAKGGVRHVVRASTPTLDELECHITTLNRGET